MSASVHVISHIELVTYRFVCKSRFQTTQSQVPVRTISVVAAIFHKNSVHYIDVICMHSAMLNDDTSLHRCVARERVLARDRLSDLSLVSSTIYCTNSIPFPSSCPPHYCPTSVDASASSSSRGRGTFIQKEPSDSGTSWSSSSIFRAYGITHSSVPRKDRRSYLTSSACVRCHPYLPSRFLYWL